jgi:hypothetical protein
MVDLIDLTESDEEDIHPVSPVSSSVDSSSSSGLVIMSVESQEPPKLHVDGDGDEFNEDSDTPAAQTAAAAVAVGFSKRDSPPLLSHFMNLDPWNYYLSTSSHSATSSVAASSGC